MSDLGEAADHFLSVAVLLLAFLSSSLSLSRVAMGAQVDAAIEDLWPFLLRMTTMASN